MARKGIPALERDRLLYVQQNYIRLGTVNVTDLLRALQGNGHSSTLARLLQNWGVSPKRSTCSRILMTLRTGGAS
jgi:hypothetical protein